MYVSWELIYMYLHLCPAVHAIMHVFNYISTLQTCCIVNLLATLSFPACILWVDKANIRSSVLHPIKLATVVAATRKTKKEETKMSCSNSLYTTIHVVFLSFFSNGFTISHKPRSMWTLKKSFHIRYNELQNQAELLFTKETKKTQHIYRRKRFKEKGMVYCSKLLMKCRKHSINVWNKREKLNCHRNSIKCFDNHKQWHDAKTKHLGFTFVKHNFYMIFTVNYLKRYVSQP